MSNPLSRNFRFMSVAVFGVAALQFCLYFLVARYLGTDGYGTFAVALTMALLAAPLCDLGMNISVVWSHAREPENLPTLLGTSLVIRALLALPVGGGALLVGHGLGFPSEVLSLFVPLFLAGLLDGVVGMFSAVFQARERMGWSSAIMIGRNLARASGLGITLLAGGGLWTLALSFVAASLGAALMCAWLVRRTTPMRFSRQAIRPVLRDAWPFGSAILANLMLLQSDILMLQFFEGEAAVGGYHAAFRFIVLAEMIPHIVSMVIIPRSYRIGHREGATSLSRFYRVQTMALGTAGLFGALLLGLYGSALADRVLGPGFAASPMLLTALAPLVFLRFMAVPLGDALASLGHQRRLCRAAWCALASNVVLNLLLIPGDGPWNGALGAALATVGSQVVMLGAQMLFAHRLLTSHWARLFAQPVAVAAVLALAVVWLPEASVWGWPVAVAALTLWILRAPIREHQAVLRALLRRPAVAIPDKPA